MKLIEARNLGEVFAMLVAGEEVAPKKLEWAWRAIERELKIQEARAGRQAAFFADRADARSADCDEDGVKMAKGALVTDDAYLTMDEVRIKGKAAKHPEQVVVNDKINAWLWKQDEQYGEVSAQAFAARTGMSESGIVGLMGLMVKRGGWVPKGENAITRSSHA